MCCCDGENSDARARLYTGVTRDEATGWSCLRARYLDTSAGTFNRLAPFLGKLDDSESLRKYVCRISWATQVAYFYISSGYRVIFYYR